VIGMLLILAGVLAVYMGITGRYQQVATAIVTGWRPPSASTHG
jgi:hypothetical protein